VFSIDFLRVIREFEYGSILKRLAPGAHVLEIGGGTGYQAKRLAQDGFSVVSIDIPDSNYADQLEFPVQPYDGRNVPFADACFDVVFSSNVLEHVRDLPRLHSEIRRVLRPGGYCVHLMPTGAWRFWSNVSNYVDLGLRLLALAPRLLPAGLSWRAFADTVNVLFRMVRTAWHLAVVKRHGESGNAMSEIVTFGKRHWLGHFRRQGFTVEEAVPTGLFYTGYMVFGDRLSLPARQKLSRYLGSACVIYKVRPATDAVPEKAGSQPAGTTEEV
jgi:SAM-dependent methyltransferase